MNDTSSAHSGDAKLKKSNVKSGASQSTRAFTKPGHGNLKLKTVSEIWTLVSAMLSDEKSTCVVEAAKRSAHAPTTQRTVPMVLRIEVGHAWHAPFSS